MPSTVAESMSRSQTGLAGVMVPALVESLCSKPHRASRIDMQLVMLWLYALVVVQQISLHPHVNRTSKRKVMAVCRVSTFSLGVRNGGSYQVRCAIRDSKLDSKDRRSFIHSLF